MTSPQNVIAWLVPTARGSSADKATHMPENSTRTIKPASAPYLNSSLPDITTSRSSKAIQLAFDQPPRRPGAFVLGTDPNTCDIVLPNRPGLSPQHCCLRFDGEARLVLEDYSECGTQVWYDWECNGDQTDYTWLLSSGASQGFPHTVRRISIDIQGVRFQVIANDHSNSWEAYEQSVEEFCRQPEWVDGLTGWDEVSVAPVAPLFSSAPLFKHIYVKAIGDEELVGEFYLWDMARPWEPMVRAVA